VGSWEDGWAVAPLVDPTPWAKSLPEEWVETEASFVRAMMVPDGHGGFEQDASVTYLTTQVHLEINIDRAAVVATGQLVQGAVVRRTWKGFVDWQDDPASNPRAGDWIAFTTTQGVSWFTQVDQVTDPANLGDHCEFLTEAFE